MSKVNFNLDKKQAWLILAIAILFVVFGFAMRLLPHPPNFTPIGAIALFGALYLPRKFALVIPLGAMLVSDAIIGFYSWPIMLAVYAGFAAMVGIGLLVRKHKRFSTVLGGTIAGSLTFFLITNFAVWAFGSLYAPTLSGLVQCYYMALPFLRNTLAGDLFYVGVLVGAVELVFLLGRYFYCLRLFKYEYREISK
ncbi:MAG: DUF6580 family putative transport protein [Patescibacteria group bacterium]